MAPKHQHMTYNDVHHLIRDSAEKIKEFRPDMLIAIGGWWSRTFLKDVDTERNIPIHAIGLSLYESLPGTTAEQIGREVIRTQWLGPESGKILLGRRALIVDEVDDSRKTLQYAVSELQKDVERELLALPEAERNAKRTHFAVFVVHNKLNRSWARCPRYPVSSNSISIICVP
ncbi:uncharacterized protein B0H18DRAFT_1011201 [Fomitopsis serialis]|uniref:uncharacterized protein n=1 Tax=Fomitopsis serialis TaxID=139415 RepID=UPI0020087530|nr:uncharacterized protein B0H18DRAFT_1011201 [Neoantrodia serialis]KAH9924783.1 hypothetical protein B0H18DRAFT_1011201 [Neoantrodia serialis]